MTPIFFSFLNPISNGSKIFVHFTYLPGKMYSNKVFNAGNAGNGIPMSRGITVKYTEFVYCWYEDCMFLWNMPVPSQEYELYSICSIG